MLTQGTAPDPNFNLNISSFLTLSHLLGCLICTRNSLSIVLLLSMMGGWDGWGVVDLHQGVGGATGGGFYLVVSCLFVLFCIGV